jgi:hypothetical protein
MQETLATTFAQERQFVASPRVNLCERARAHTHSLRWAMLTAVHYLQCFLSLLNKRAQRAMTGDKGLRVMVQTRCEEIHSTITVCPSEQARLRPRPRPGT